MTTQTFSSSGALLVYVNNTWDSVVLYPSTTFARLIMTSRIECPEAGGSCRQIDTNFAYDSYGNPYFTQYSGDASVTGDERTEVTDWIVDTTSWLHRPKRVGVHTGSLGPIIRERWFWYDGLTTWGAIGTRGLLTREESRVSAAGGQGAAGNPVVTHTYDPYGNRTSTTDPRSCTTTTAYESTQTYPSTITTCLNFATQFAYDHRFGVTTSVTDPNLQTTTYAYDVFGRPTRVTGPLDTASANGTVSYFYLDFGNPSLQRVQTLRTQNHGGSDVISTLDYFDGLGRGYEQQLQACCNGAIVTSRTYDSRGLVASVTAPHFASEAAVSTTYVHDPLGRDTRVNNPDGTFRTAVYAASMVTITDERGTVRKRYLDAYNRLIRVDELNGTETYTTAYQYDAVGALIQTRNHLGHITNIGYDLLGRKTTMQDPNMGSWVYGYDTAGNLTSQTDANNQTLTFAYDLQGRLRTKTYPDGRHIDWTYDDSTVPFYKGRLTRVVDLATDTRFVYNALGEVVQTTRNLDGVTYTMSNTYDAMGRVISRTFPDNETATFTYNSAGWLAGINGYVDGISYNARGQRVNVWYPNGAVSSFIYHPQNFRITNRTTTAASVNVQNLSFSYDNIGNITQISDGTTFGTAGRTFGYDPLNRLTSASGTFGPPSGGLPTQANPPAYTYNAIGDPQQFEGATYAYSDPSHPSAVTSITPGGTYQYDFNGNMIDGAGRASTWDADNRLSATTIQGGNSATFAYDYTGQRVRKTTTGAGTTYYPFPDYEIAPDGVITKYVRFKDEIMAAKKSTGERFFYHADQLGSVHVITDIAGVRAQLIEYSPWGRVVRSEGTVNPTKGFNGNDLDEPEIGLLYYNGRYYIAGIGRFMSPDPIVPIPGNPQSLNRYSYVLNNPVRLIDPTGYSFFDDIGKFFKKHWKQIVSAVVGAVVTIAVTVLTWNPVLGAAAGIMVSSTLYGGLTGGWSGAGYGALAGAGYVVGGLLGGAAGAIVGGAITTGLSTELQGGSFWAGFGSGAIAGIFSTVGGLCGCGAGVVAAGAASGAVNAAIFGGNVGEGAAIGAVTAAITVAVAYGGYRAYQAISDVFVSVPQPDTRFSAEARAMLAAGDTQEFASVPAAEAASASASGLSREAATLAGEAAHNIHVGELATGLGALTIAAGIVTSNRALVIIGGVIFIYGIDRYATGSAQLRLLENLNGPR